MKYFVCSKCLGLKGPAVRCLWATDRDEEVDSFQHRGCPQTSDPVFESVSKEIFLDFASRPSGVFRLSDLPKKLFDELRYKIGSEEEQLFVEQFIDCYTETYECDTDGAAKVFLKYANLINAQFLWGKHPSDVVLLVESFKY
jgi:hypothetical protein